MTNRSIVLWLLLLTACGASKDPDAQTIIREINYSQIQKGQGVYALIGAHLVDGRGGEPIENSCVIIRNGVIEAVGKSGEVDIPAAAKQVMLTGVTMLPGLIDAHYHNEDSDTLTSLYLMNGVTSVRDPGEWIESYQHLRRPGRTIPRLFLAGPHLDQYPPAYPADSYIVRDAVEAGLAVDRLAQQGATVVKVYYGLSVGMIREVCRRSAKYGLPVTAHLEITDARDAINAGLDGIEHVTSFGLCLLPMREGEKYKQAVMADKNARRRGRYEVWASISMHNNPVVDSLITFLAQRKTFVSPTLAVFERRFDRGDSIEVKGFENMLAFVGLANQNGVRFFIGSHSYVPYAEPGFAFQREMELMHEAGLSNMQVIVAATLENARFFRIDERLGSIEPGKVADLVVVNGNPLEDVAVMRNVTGVMLNGVWVKEPHHDPAQKAP
jgi:imidazolonepropionase-like amidohydrolase